MRVYEITLSREAQTLSMKEPRGGPEFESGHSGRDRPRWVSVMRFEDAAVDGRNAQDIVEKLGN